MKKLYCPFCGSRLRERGKKGICPLCGLPFYDNPLPATAAVAQNPKGEVILVKRAVEPGLGKWCLPGGFLEGDESPEEGVLRELKEETGLEGEIRELIGVVHERSSLYGPVVIIGYRLMVTGGEMRPGDDAQEVRFFPPGEIPEMAFRSHMKLLQGAIR
ncbi:MAG: hypothetical protein DRG31_00575 [Deltaproteobacteria bacterium]|nr:MAG: hypothetical protein DRG31_00575 [Deltaproteobacteria bacterium]